MKKWIAILSISISSVLATSDGAELFKVNCASCHQSGHSELAPPERGITMRYKRSFRDKESFVAGIVSWVHNPDPDKAKMRGAVRKFGEMPPLSLDDSTVRSIAEYLWER